MGTNAMRMSGADRVAYRHQKQQQPRLSPQASLGKNRSRRRTTASSSSTNHWWSNCFNAILALITLQLACTLFVVINFGLGNDSLAGYGVVTQLQNLGELVSNVSSSGSNSDDSNDSQDNNGPEVVEEEIEYDYDSSVLNRTRTSFLDNYRSRKHFSENYRAPFLVVGGSDGSGTRAIVHTLIELGVFVFKEDRNSGDITGEEMFQRGGWPPLVNLIMKETHSGNYELSDLSETAREKAKAELRKLRRSVAQKAWQAYKRRHHPRNLGHQFDTNYEESLLRNLLVNDTDYATGSNIAWKAPVSMMLLPVLKEVFGPIRFLHCVRDGRDVALSDNQSPVRKFFNTYYGLPSDAPILDNETQPKAMQLWNDWNLQVMDWGKNHSDGETFDYLTIRSEDLINPATRFESLVRLAHFVGSRKTVKELCCMSQRTLKDLGKSVADVGDPRAAKGHNFMFGRLGRRHHRPRTQEEMHDFIGRAKHVFMGEKDIDRHPFWERGLSREEIRRMKEKYDGRPHGKEAIREMKEEFYDKYHSYHGGPLPPEISEGLKQRVGQRKLLQADAKSNFDFRRRYHLPDGYIRRKKTLNEDKENAGQRSRAELGRANLLQRVIQRLGSRDREPEIGESRNRGIPDPMEKFFGRKGPKEAPEKVMARYGKWVKLLEDKPELSAKLHEYGSAALKAFGYEPTRDFLDPIDESYVEQCREILANRGC